MAHSSVSCIICKDEVKIHDQKGKLSSTTSRRHQTQSNHGNENISRWKYLVAESFCMLFGLPVNHEFVFSFCGEGESQLCNQCLQDLSDVHFIFWQLHNLEVKLVKLRNVLFQRLNLSLETQETGNCSDFAEIAKKLLKDINSGSHILPTGVYITRWKDALENVNRRVPNADLLPYRLRPKTEIKVDTDPDYFNESSPTPVSPNSLEDADYFLDENAADDENDNDFIVDSRVEENDDPVSDDFEEDDEHDEDEDYKEDKKRKRRKTEGASRIKNDYTFTKDDEGNFVCSVDPDLCNRSFPTRSHLSKHFSDFHKGRDFPCDQTGCVQKFKSELTLIHHKRKIHGLTIETTVKPRKRLIDPQDGKPGILCTEDPSICNRMYERMKDLNKHIADFHKGRDYACDHDDCVQKFKSELRLSQHKRLVHKIGVEIKPEPKIRGKYKKKTDSKEIIDQPTFPSLCELCGISIPNAKQRRRHFKVNHLGYGRFKCDLCGMDFSNSEEVKIHEDLHAQYASTLPFTCVGDGGGCQELFTNTVDLRRHVKKNHLSSGLKCKICGVMKPNQFVMQRHVREVHDPNREKNQVCEECGKSYFTPQALKEHVSSTHSREPMNCDVCGKGFYRKSVLWHHKLSHQKVKPYGCSICGKGFFNTMQLKKHEEIHAGVKKYQCGECGKRFKQMQNLRQHLRTQVHQKPQKDKKVAERGDEDDGVVGEGESVKYE